MATESSWKHCGCALPPETDERLRESVWADAAQVRVAALKRRTASRGRPRRENGKRKHVFTLHGRMEGGVGDDCRTCGIKAEQRGPECVDLQWLLARWCWFGCFRKEVSESLQDSETLSLKSRRKWQIPPFSQKQWCEGSWEDFVNFFVCSSSSAERKQTGGWCLRRLARHHWLLFPFFPQRNESVTVPSEASTPPSFSSTVGLSNLTTATWLSIASSSPPSTKVVHEIGANDVTSNANHVYSVFAALGLLAGCFLLYGFVQTYRAQRCLAWLYRLLTAFCCLQLLLLLFSMHMLFTRSNYLQTTVLGCATLYFAIDATSLCGLLVLALMAYALTLDPPPNALLRKAWVCAALVLLTSTVVSLLLAGLRRPHADLQKRIDCDRRQVPLSYASTRLFLAVLLPYSLQFGLLVCGLVRQCKTKGRFLSGSEEGPIYLMVTLLMLFCQLFYSVVLVRSAQQEVLSAKGLAFVSVAEYVLYFGSSCSLLLVLFVHRPCRENLYTLFRQLRDCCQNPGHSQPNRNIIAPHIEITDTLQDIES